jgi:cytochrome c oxidase subunit 1
VSTLGLLLLLDQLSVGEVFGVGGFDPLTYEHLFSFLIRAGIAVVLLPALGIVGEVITTFSRKAPEGGVSTPIAFGCLAVLALVGGGVEGIASGQTIAYSVAQSGLRLLALAPAAVLLYNAIGTLNQAAIRISTPLLHAIGFIFVVTIGGLSGLFLSTLSTGSYLVGSSFSAGHLHLLMGGSALMGLTTGLYYWWPCLYARVPSDATGRLGAALLFAGFLLAFIPRLIVGSHGLSALSQATGFYASTLEAATSSGLAILLLGVGAVIWNLVASLWNEAAAPSNPWGATTGEWGAVPGCDHCYDFASLRFDSATQNYVREEQAATGQ